MLYNAMHGLRIDEERYRGRGDVVTADMLQEQHRALALVLPEWWEACGDEE